MSEEKEVPALPIVPEKKLLSDTEELTMLSAPEELLEITAPQDILLLNPEHTDLVDIPELTTPTEQVTSTLTPLGVESEAVNILDPSIFDTVGTGDTAPIISESTQDILPLVEDKILDFVPAPALVTPESPVLGESIPLAPLMVTRAEEPVIATNLDQPITPVVHKSKIIIGTVVFLLIVAGVFAGYMYSNNSPKKTVDIAYTISSEVSVPTYENTVTQVIESEQKDIELMNQAASENNANICNMITMDSRKTECYETLSARAITASGTVQDCQRITLATLRDNCISVVVQSDAMRALDKSLCSQIADATQSQYCGELVDQRSLAQMIDSNTASEATCSNLGEKYRAQCMESIKQLDDSAVLQKAISEENLDTCKLLSTEELQFTCFDTILLKQALKSRDKNLCDYVRDEGKKDTCLSYMKTQDDNSLFKTAILEKNINMCSQITVDTLKTRCHDSVILLLVRDTKDIALCDTLIATGSIASCKASIQLN